MIEHGILKRQMAILLLWLSPLSFTACHGIHSMTGELQLIKEKPFSISPGKDLFVDVSSGGVMVTSWDKSEVYVKILGNENAMEKMNFSMKGTEELVKITGKKKSSSSSWFSNINVKVEIKVPAEFNVDINTSGGDVKCGGLTGRAKLNTSGGDVWTDKFSGYLNASTSGGDVYLFCYDALIEASTSGGDIKLEYKGENKGIDLSTSGGNIKVKVPEDFNASVELSTSGGDVSCSLNMSNIQKSSGSKLIGDINMGGEKLSANTSGGDITVTSR